MLVLGAADKVEANASASFNEGYVRSEDACRWVGSKVATASNCPEESRATYAGVGEIKYGAMKECNASDREFFACSSSWSNDSVPFSPARNKISAFPNGPIPSIVDINDLDRGWSGSKDRAASISGGEDCRGFRRGRIGGGT